MVCGNRHPLVRELRAGDRRDDVGRQSVADVDSILEGHFDRPARQRLLKGLRVGLADRRGRQLLVVPHAVLLQRVLAATRIVVHDQGQRAAACGLDELIGRPSAGPAHQDDLAGDRTGSCVIGREPVARIDQRRADAMPIGTVIAARVAHAIAHSPGASRRVETDRIQALPRRRQRDRPVLVVAHRKEFLVRLQPERLQLPFDVVGERLFVGAARHRRSGADAGVVLDDVLRQTAGRGKSAADVEAIDDRAFLGGQLRSRGQRMTQQRNEDSSQYFRLGVHSRVVYERCNLVNERRFCVPCSGPGAFS